MESAYPVFVAPGQAPKPLAEILVESAQQARRLRPPVMADVTVSAVAFDGCGAACKIVLSELPDAPSIREALASAAGVRTAALAIGPEGGWTDEEIVAARGAGFVEASLGENILRTETAVLASLAVLRFAAEAPR